MNDDRLMWRVIDTYQRTIDAAEAQSKAITELLQSIEAYRQWLEQTSLKLAGNGPEAEERTDG